MRMTTVLNPKRTNPASAENGKKGGVGMKHLSPTEVAARMKVSSSTVRLWLSQGRFPGAIPPHAEWKVPEDALKNFVAPDRRGPKKKACDSPVEMKGERQ